MVIRHNYTRKAGVARSAVRYYQMRPRGEHEPPRGIFTASGAVTRGEALRLLAESQPERDPLAPVRRGQEGRPFLAHRIVLAPSDEERPEDLREMARGVMRELSREKGLALAWFAVAHRHTEHHHVHVILVHVILCGGGLDRDGKLREVRLSREDHARMKADGAAYCAWERQEREEWDRLLAAAGEVEHEATPPEREPPGPSAEAPDRERPPERGYER